MAQTLARIAAIQSRAGADELAVSTYRRAVARDAQPSAAVSLARLLDAARRRTGRRRGPRQILRQSRDDEAIIEAGRLAIELDEFAGRLPALESGLAEAFAGGTGLARPPPDAGGGAQALLADAVSRSRVRRRRACVWAATRSAGAAGGGHRSRTDAGPRASSSCWACSATATPRRRWHGSRPATPEPLGRGAASDARAERCRRGADPAGGGHRAGATAVTRAVAPAIERFTCAYQRRQTRTAAIWAPRAPRRRRVTPNSSRRSTTASPDVVAAACLGLGRRGDHVVGCSRWRRTAAAERSARRPCAGRGRGPPPRRRPRQRVGAAVRSARLRGRRLSRAAGSRWPGGATGARCSAAGARAAAPPHALSERRASRSKRSPPGPGVSVPARRGARSSGRAASTSQAARPRSAPSPTADLQPLWRGTRASCRTSWRTRLARGGDARREALAALDGTPDAPGLGALDARARRRAQRRNRGRRSRGRRCARRQAGRLLDDPDDEARASALRVLAKLGDERVTPARIAAAARERRRPWRPRPSSPPARLAARSGPTVAPAIAAALAPALGDESWRNRRIAAVDVAGGPRARRRPSSERARNDKHPRSCGAPPSRRSPRNALT